LQAAGEKPRTKSDPPRFWKSDPYAWENSLKTPGKVRLTETLERLVQLDQATGKKDDAGK